MKRLFVVLMVLALVFVLSAAAFAQKDLPNYDPKTELTLKKAVVEDVKEVTLPQGKNRFQLLVKVETESYQVCLCPKAFLEMLDASFAKGDELEITGSKVQDAENNTLILAREVVKGNNTLVLRDKNGEPVWTWIEKKPGGGK